MITAVIPLPNFTQVFLQRADAQLGIPPIDGYDSSNASFSIGREFGLGVQQWYKYKLIMMDPFHDLKTEAKMFLSNPEECMGMSDIVFISNRPIDLDTYVSDPTNVIYPIYGHCCGMAVIFAKSVERFLHINDFYAASEIITPFDFWHEQYALHMGRPSPELLVSESIEQVASGFAEVRNHHGFSLAQLAEFITYQETSKSESIRNQLETINNIAIYPETFLRVANSVSWGEIQPFVNEFMDKTNNLRTATVNSMYMWEDIGKRLIESLCICTHVTEPTWMDKLIGEFIYQNDDFYFDIDMNQPHPTIPDVYSRTIFTDVQFQTSDPHRSPVAKDLLHLLIKCVGLGGIGRKVRIFRSSMEDVTITDIDTGEVLCYIDLVWWAIAASNGLIDRTYL